MKERKNYDLVDIVKFAMCLIVVGIHSHPFISYSTDFDMFFFNVFGSLAVPFFFISSGFFLYKDRQDKNFSYTKKFVSRILKLYLFWLILNLPFTLVNCYYNGDSNVSSALLIFIRDNLTLSSFRGAWFLGSLVFGALTIYYFSVHKNISSKKLFLIFLGFNLILYILNGYLRIFSFNNYLFSFFLEPFGLIKSLPYMLVGKMIAENNFKDKLISKKYLFIIFLISLIIMPIEYIYLGDAFLSRITTTIILFTITLSFNVNFKRALDFRKMSIIIFCFHFDVCFVFDALNHFFNFSINSGIKYFIILIASITFSKVIFKLEDKKKFRFLKNSY